MKTKTIIAFLLVCTILVACDRSLQSVETSNISTQTPSEPIQYPSLIPSGFLKTRGQSIVNSETGEAIVLQGVNFPNDMTIAFDDYKNVNTLNANFVRLALDFSAFSSSPDWTWLDQQIDWAKQNGIYLSLVITGGPKDLVWNNETLQETVIVLWTSIASKYANENTIATFDLLDQPTPDNLDQWQSLAERITTSIRSVDDQHMLVVQGVEIPDRTFIYLDDPNYILGFPFFKPFELTRLNQGQYPSSDLFLPDWSQFVGVEGIRSYSLKEGTSEWYETRSPLKLITNREIQLGTPSMSCINSLGDVYFSDFIVEEYGENGLFLRNVINIDLSKDRFWGPWSNKDSAVIELVDDHLFGKAIKFSPKIEGQPATGTVADMAYAFEMVHGHSYSIYGWLRGEKINSDANCKFYVETYTLSSSDPLIVWDKEHLEGELSRFANYGKQHHVPMMLLDFGTIRRSISNGGDQWLTDMLNILDKFELNYAYSSLRDDQLGLFDKKGTTDLSLHSIFKNRPNNIPQSDTFNEQDSSTRGVDTSHGFVHTQGQELVVGSSDQRVYLRGINFSNFNYSGIYKNLPHHSKRDFYAVRDMGMNVIRFNLSYLYFEKDETPYQYDPQVWTWLDQQIAWAKEAGVYIILNMHIVPGQFPTMELTTNPEDQQRAAELWKAIAERYRDETIIAGYDLINEPYGITNSEYQSYAQLLVDAIREVDPNHMIVVEEIMGPSPGFVLVNDNNVMYDFHFYHPYDLTHENGNNLVSAGPYPDEKSIELNWDTITGLSMSRTLALPTGNSDWILYESLPYSPVSQHSGSIVGYGKIMCDQNLGKAYFGDLQIISIDQDKVSQIIMDITINHNLQINRSLEGGMTSFGISPLNPLNLPEGRSLTLSEVDVFAWTEFPPFEVMPGVSYQIKGWMQGENITPGSDCHLLIEWHQLPENEALVRRNREYLLGKVLEGVVFGQEHNLPINIGEFGVIETTFYPHKGGLIWIEDMLSILIENKLNFTYWGYHGSWGIYNDMEHYPDTADAQQEMVDLFVKYLK